jgi:predicted site-specific integrase-resolvase
MKEVGSGVNDGRRKLLALLADPTVTVIVVEDIIADFVSILYSFCARLYGQRRAKRKTEKIVQDLREEKEEKSEQQLHRSRG